MPNDKLKKLHDILVSRGIDNKSFEEFKSNFSSDTDKQKKLHDILVSRGIDNKSFEEFKSNFFFQEDELQPTSQEVVTESITKEETTPTLLESSKKTTDFEEILDYSEEKALPYFRKELESKGFSIEETGIGNALLVTDNITGEQTEIDLKPIEFFGSSKEEQIQKIKKLQSVNPDPKRRLLSVNKFDTYKESVSNNDIENDPFVSQLKNTYSGFNFNLDYDPIRNGKVLTVSKGDVSTTFELQNFNEPLEKKFSSINKFIYDNINDDEAIKSLSDYGVKILEEKNKRIKEEEEKTIDISEDAVNSDLYNEEYFSRLFNYLESNDISIPQEAKNQLKPGGRIQQYYVGSASGPRLVTKSLPYTKEEILSLKEQYFGNNPDVLNAISYFDKFERLNIVKNRVDRSKKLAKERVLENSTDRESFAEIVDQKYEGLSGRKKEIAVNLEIAVKDYKLFKDEVVKKRLEEISSENPEVKIQLFEDEKTGRITGLNSSEPLDELKTLKQDIIFQNKSLIDLAQKSDSELAKIDSSLENVNEWREATKKNYSIVDNALMDLKSASADLAGNILVVKTLAQEGFQDLTGIQTTYLMPPQVERDAIRGEMAEIRKEKDDYFESMRNYQEAIKEGSFGTFFARQLATQTPNLTLAIGTGAVGNAVGLSGGTISTLVSTGFGVSAAGAKYDEITTRQEFAEKAQKALNDLEDVKDFLSEEDYFNQKYELERASKDLDITSTDKTLSVVGAGLTEFGVSRFIGTVPNSLKVIKDLRKSGQFIDDLYRSNFKAIKDSGLELLKRTGGEILEETSIETLNKLNNYIFLGDKIDFSDLDDVAVTSIITSGSMNTPGLAYSTLLSQSNINKYKSRVNGIVSNITNLKESLKDPEMNDGVRDIIHREITDNIKELAGVTTNLEGDALLLGSKNLRDLIMLSSMEKSLLDKAGVEVDDNYSQANAKVKAYIDTLDKDEATKYTDKLQFIDQKRKNIVSDLDYTNAVEEVFGEKGTKIAEGLDDKLTPQQKYVEVYKQIRQEINDNAKKEYDAIQEQEVIITPETSSNYANMTEDGEGNFVFYHVGQEGYSTIEPRPGDTKATSAVERSALTKVGGLAMYYTSPESRETVVSGKARYQVKVPVERVYDFNNDPLNFNEEGKKRHSEEHPGKAYDANTSLAYVTKIAGENGFDMVVADWNGETRAQTTKALAPVDLEIRDGNTITKKFDNEYESNAKKGFESVVPESKQSKFDDLYNEIYKERNKESRYDELYFLYEKKRDYTQEQITELINNSDISQEIKDKYNSILESKEEKRKSVKIDTELVVSNGVKVKSAPDGTYIDVEMIAGKDGRKLSPEEVLDAIPLDGIEFDNDGKNLRIKLPRELTPTEMMSLMKATEQEAIGQIHNGVGKLYAQSKKLLEDYGNEFNENYFKLPREGKLKKYEKKPKKIIKDERPKAGNRLFNEPLKEVKEIANRYYERVFGKERPKFEGTRKLDKEFAKRISDAFENMQNNPNDPDVKASYEAMAKETMDQYQDFIDAGYTVEINNEEPYANSQEMIDDLRKNKRIKIFSTESGFGDTPITDKQRNDNPLLRDSGVKDINGQTMLINDVFRAIHDFYGHAELGNSFGPKGEENAWQVHARMFSPLARRAMTTETRGQNSYVNFSGVNKKVDALREKARKLREQGKDAQKVVDEIYKLTRFADQKVGLLPEEFSNIDGIEKLRQIFGKRQFSDGTVNTLSDKLAIVKQANRAIKSLAKLFPDVKINVFYEERNYHQAIGVEDFSAGSYDGNNTININLTRATKTTVAHEVFHAILAKSLKSDKAIQDLTKKFVDSLLKTQDKRLIKLLQDAVGDIKQYENVQNEEVMSELFGVLAGYNKKLDKDTRSLVKRFFDRLAKLFGLKKFTDSELVDVLNTLARKVQAGQEITDLGFMEQGDVEGVLTDRKQVSSRPSISEVRKAARENGISEADTNAFLKELGYTQDEIAEVPKRKTIENELESFANRVIEEGIDSFSDEALQFYAENKEALDKIIEEKQKQKPKTDSKSRSLSLKIVEGKKDFSDAEIDLFAANEDKIRAEVDSIANTRGIQITSDNYKDIIKSTKRPRKKVTVNEYTALKDQIRLEARAARDAQRDLNLKRKDIAAMIKDLSSKGKITANQSKVLINRVSSVNLNNDQSVEKLIKYMDKVYKNAEYADNILRSNKKRENAKKNIRTKIGSANVVFNTLNKLFSIDAKLIPQDVLDTYNDIVNQFGESRAVLKLEDVSVINEKANSILEAIDKEVSEIPKLQLLFEGLDKVIIKGKEDFAATIAQALSNEEITREDFDLMKKYKKDIIPPVEKTKSDTEPFAFEFKKNNVEDSMENKGASRLIELLKNKKAVDQLSDGIKKNIQSVIDNIDSGFFPSYANNIANEIESIIAKDKVVPRIKKGRYVIDRAVAKIKNFFASNRSTLEYQIRQNPLSDIDNVLGNMNRTDIYDNIFGKAAKSYATLDAEIDTVHEKILKADALLLNQFKNNGNKVTESKYRIMAYMLEREFQSNKDNNKVFSASEAIKAAIDSQKKGKTTIYSKRDIKILESILKDFDGDVNIKNVFDKFSKREKKAIAIIDEVNKSIADKALYTASVIRGARPNMIDNYVHHSVASSNENTVESITSKYNQFKTFSTKAGTLIERTPGVKALDFDVLKSTLKGAKETLTDYHMTDTARVIFKTLNKIQADIIADKNSTDRQIETANALISAFDTAMRQVFEMNYVNNGMNLLSRIKGLGYKALLASVPRAAAELGSNFSYVILTSPKAFAIGSKYREYVLDQRGRDIMMNLNSEQTGKLYSKKVTGKTADIGLFVDSEGASPTGAVNELQNRANQILSYSSKVTTKPTEKIAEALISTPDKAISRPLWFGSLDTKFKELTGKKIDMEAIRNQDSKYLRDNKEALDKATRFADKEVTRAATSINVFNGVLKNKIDPNDSTTLKTIKEINGFMTNFMIYEYTTARSAISAIINSGEISRQKGASLLLGTLTRMSLYMVLYQLFSHTFDSVVAAVTGADIGDEEPPEEDLLLRQLVGSIFSMIVGKNLGNFAKILPNMSLEAINEKYLENLRKGNEYDPYKHSISFSMLSREDLKDIETGRSGIGDVLLKSFSGPYSPIIKTLSRSAILLSKIKSEKSKDSTKERAKDELTKRIILEMMGNMGMIPFYKDVRRIVIKDFFKEQKEEKSNLRVNLRSNNIIIRK